MTDRKALLNDMWWATGHGGTAEECTAIALRHIAQALEKAAMICDDGRPRDAKAWALDAPLVEAAAEIRALKELP